MISKQSSTEFIWHAADNRIVDRKYQEFDEYSCSFKKELPEGQALIGALQQLHMDRIKPRNVLVYAKKWAAYSTTEITSICH